MFVCSFDYVCLVRGLSIRDKKPHSIHITNGNTEQKPNNEANELKIKWDLFTDSWSQGEKPMEKC